MGESLDLSKPLLLSEVPLEEEPSDKDEEYNVGQDEVSNHSKESRQSVLSTHKVISASKPPIDS